MALVEKRTITSPSVTSPLRDMGIRREREHSHTQRQLHRDVFLLAVRAPLRRQPWVLEVRIQQSRGSVCHYQPINVFVKPLALFAVHVARL